MKIDVINCQTFISLYKFFYMEQIHRAGIFNKLNVSVFLMLLEFFEYIYIHTHTHTHTQILVRRKKLFWRRM